MSDLLEFAGTSELSDTWGTLKEFEFLQDIPRTNLEFWWKADDITTAADGDAITTLTNIAGTGNPTQGTLANRAIYRTNSINGRPALDFDGVNDYYIVNGPQAAFLGEDLPITAYAVYSADVTNVIMCYLSMGRVFTSGTSLRFINRDTGVYRAIKTDDAGTTVNRDGGTAKTTPVLRVDLSPGTTYSLWENETSEVSAGAFNVGNLTVARFAIGAAYIQDVVSGYFNGQIAEVLVYSTSHSEATRLLITRYLKNKYRLYV
jgi:hypothetical protein